MRTDLPIKIDIPSGFLDEEIRFNYTISREMKEVWAVELDLYFELRRVCEKYNLGLMADAGTILGAIRDGGFIPWDNDLDFSMSREDYETLCKLAGDEFKYPYFWQTEETDPGSCRGHGQLRNSETTAILKSEVFNNSYFGFNQGIFIDVFPFDKVPDDEKERHEFLKRLKSYESKWLSYRDIMMGQNKSVGLKRIFKFLIKKYYYDRIGYKNKNFQEMEALKKKYLGSRTNLVANLFYVRNDNLDFLVRPQKWFDVVCEIPFEFTTITVPGGFDYYLTKAYGDWQQRLNSNTMHGDMICNAKMSYRDYIYKGKGFGMSSQMLNFTVGPVMSDPDIIEVANHSTPYFRTSEFSEIMKENERLFLDFLNAPAGSRAVFLTASGTGSMESAVMNILNDKDKIIVINGGSFGQRFVELCELHQRAFTEVKCEFGHQLKIKQLSGLEDHTALLINMHETSSGVLYDMKMVSEFCRENNILLIVDAISAFIADDLDMAELGAAVVITGSQKALAVQPGVSLIALAPAAIDRVEENKEVCMYLSLKQALKNGERGQTPFTPAVTTLLQINKRLTQISNRGGYSRRGRISPLWLRTSETA